MLQRTPEGVPEDANPIGDKSECDGQVVEGPQGGLYCVPEGTDADDDTEGGEDSGQNGETTISVDGTPQEVFEEVSDSEEVAERVSELSQSWTAWPTDKSTQAMWQAAAEITDNENDPGDPFGDPLLGPGADQEDVDAYQEYKTNLESKLREEHGDEITAHRFIHGEPAERLRNGESLQPRTLGSWTTNADQLDNLVDEVAPNPEEARENAVVVEMNIPVENVMDAHVANPELDDAGQEELIAALDFSDDLQDGQVKQLDEV